MTLFLLDIYYGDDAPTTPQHVDFVKMRAAGAVGVIVKAGTSGNNYQVNVQVNTTENQIIHLTATVQVRNQLPS